MLKAAPDSDWNALQAALCGRDETPAHRRPYRPAFLVPEAGQTGFQVCVGPVCQPPTADIAAVAGLL